MSHFAQKIGPFIGIFLLIAAHVSVAQAQTANDRNNASQQSERIQREQQLRQQEDINRGLQSTRPPTQIEVAPVKVPTGHGSGCRLIHHIILEGSDRIPAKTGHSIIDPYLGKCLGVDEIQRLLGAVTNYYIQAGLATTRVYLPSQDLSKGTLRIRIIEGIVGGIHMDKTDAGTASIATAFPFVEGGVLNLRDIEQGLDQINRLASNNATMDIEPGGKVGESTIVIKNPATKRWHVNMTADDYGETTTGRNELGGTLSLDNLLGLNENYTVTERKTLPIDHDAKQSSSTTALVSVPFGYTTLSGGYTRSDYDSTLLTPGGESLHLNGDNRIAFGSVDHVYYRDQDGRANVTATLTRKRADNFIAGQRLDVSSRTLTVLDIGSGYNTTLFGGSANILGIYSRGLTTFNALHDQDNLPSETPRAQFNKFSINAGYVRPFQVAQKNLSFSTQFSGQYSLDPLYGSEQISVGGIYTVRGFYRESLANDNGYFVRNDLTLHQPLPSVWSQAVTLSPYAALDFGSVGSRRVDGSQAGTVVGGAVGFGLSIGPAVSFDIYGGTPLAAPKEMMRREGYNTFARLSVNF